MSKRPPGKKNSEALTVADLHPLPPAPHSLPIPGAPALIRLGRRDEDHALALTPKEEQAVAREAPEVLFREEHANPALAQTLDAQRVLVGAFSGRLLEHARAVRESLLLAQTRLPVDLLTQTPAAPAPVIKKESKKMRVAADGVLIGNYMSTLERIHPASPTELHKMAAFYTSVGDGFEPETPFGGLHPESYAMFKALAERHYREYEKRDQGLDTRMTDIPRAGALPRLSAEERLVFRMPPLPGARCCRLREACAFRRKFPTDAYRSYVAREFYLGATPPTEGPCGLCIDDVLIEYRKQWYLNTEQGYTPPRPINEFEVLVGPGQYSPEFLLLAEMNGRATGIAGQVPAYDMKQREYREIPPELATKYGLTEYMESGKVSGFYLAEINVSPAVTEVPPPPQEDPMILV